MEHSISIIMKQEQFTTTILTAARGKFLTQATSDIDISERIIATKIALGKNDSPDNWCEISAEDAEYFENQRAQAEA